MSWLLPPGVVAVIGETLDVLEAASVGENLRYWNSLLDLMWTLGPAAVLLAVAVRHRREPING